MRVPEPTRTVRFQSDRTIVVGMNNPYSTDPKMALFPAPEQSAGYRLYAMLRDAAAAEGEVIHRSRYATTFERHNLLVGEWTTRDANEAALKFLDDHSVRNIIVLGRSVERAMRIQRRVGWGVWFYHYHLPRPTSVCVIPHPSGLCREYNDPAMRLAIGRVLLKQYRRGTPEGIKGDAEAS